MSLPLRFWFFKLGMGRLSKSMEQYAPLIFIVFIVGPEYGTTEAAWKGICSEAERRCELHTRYISGFRD